MDSGTIGRKDPVETSPTMLVLLSDNVRVSIEKGVGIGIHQVKNACISLFDRHVVQGYWRKFFKQSIALSPGQTICNNIL